MLVIEVPTNKPIARLDLDDRVYKTKKEKYLAIAKDIKSNYEKGRPVLVGTPSVYVSEIIDEILTRMNIPHQVLNAKNHALEASIIANAGQVGSVTVATNMAGRGTDIVLSDESKKIGGLKVIGVERNDSRRVDNQLRGRSGRQGDIGESVFYLSLEDELMKLFGNNTSLNTLFAMNNTYGEPIENKMLSKVIQQAQKQIEGVHFGMRKNVMKYDEIISKQRNILYNDRNKLLENDIVENYKRLIESFIDRISKGYIKEEEDEYIDYVIKQLKDNIDFYSLENFVKETILTKEDLIKFLLDNFNQKIQEYSLSEIEIVIKHIILNNVDETWTIYLDEVSELQKGIGLRSYKQQDPILEFISESNILFDSLMLQIQVNTIKETLFIDLEDIS